MDYSVIYNSLTSSRKPRGLDKSCLEGYYEKHHIVPRCMGGGDEYDNLVLLTAREHFVAHKLLHKVHPDNTKILLSYVIMARTKNKEHNLGITSREFSCIRGWLHYGQLGEKNHAFGKKQTKEHISKKLLSMDKLHKSERGAEVRARMSDSLKRYYSTEVGKETMEKIALNNTGRKNTQETKDKMSKIRSDFYKTERGMAINDILGSLNRGKMPFERGTVLCNRDYTRKWSMSDYYYQEWLASGKEKATKFQRHIEKLTGETLKVSFFVTMVAKFISGWVPMEDLKYIKFINGLNTTMRTS